MGKFLKVFLLFFGATQFHSIVNAENNKSSAHFLLETLSARHAGMGGIFTATTRNTDALFSNPSGLSCSNQPEINFSYASAFDNGVYGFSGYSHPIVQRKDAQFSVGTGILYFNAGNIDINNANGTTQSMNAEKSFSAGFSFAGRIEWFSFGLTPKWIRSTLVDQFTGTTYAVDTGVMILPFPRTLKQRIVLGAAVQNLGAKIKYRTAEQDLPQTRSAGVSLKFWDNPEYGSFLIAAQGEQILDEKLRYRLGGEYSMGGAPSARMFTIRGGYRIHFDSEDYSFGVGVRERNIQLEYAYVNSMDLEKTHRLTLLFHFGKMKEEGLSMPKLMDEEKELSLKEKNILLKTNKDEKIELIKEKKEKNELIRNEEPTKEILIKEEDKNPERENQLIEKD